MPTSEVERALMDGARRSRIACSVPAQDAWPERVWRRYHWPLIGGGLLVLLELLGSLIGSNLRHF